MAVGAEQPFPRDQSSDKARVEAVIAGRGEGQGNPRHVGPPVNRKQAVGNSPPEDGQTAGFEPSGEPLVQIGHSAGEEKIQFDLVVVVNRAHRLRGGFAHGAESVRFQSEVVHTLLFRISVRVFKEEVRAGKGHDGRIKQTQ